MKIVFLDAGTLGEGITLEPLKKLGEFRDFDSTSKDQVLSRVSEADIIITNKVIIDKKILASTKQLKLVVAAATGLNHIDVEACKEKNILVKNVSSYSTDSVSQHTFAILFHLLHRLEYFQQYTKNKKWSESQFFTHLGREFFEIKNKKWGIIGLGEIGNQVATIASSFGAKISYYSSSDKDRTDKYPRVDLKTLLSESDIITIHSQLNSQTKNLVNSSNLELLKESAILINVGRGGIINEVDLVDYFIKNNILVGLDVLETEPMTKDCVVNKMLSSERFLLTPHIAWSSVEARQRLIDKIAENITKNI